LESGTVATANGVRTLAGKLIEGSGLVVEEAEKGVTWVGDEVETSGKFIESDQRAGTAAKPTPVTKR
jgi:hypothetical protein